MRRRHKRMEPDCLVYGLVDPRDGMIRYVGRSRDGFTRPLQHERGASNRLVAAWADELLALGLTFSVVTLEVCCRPNDLPEVEARWVSRGWEFGWPLLNTRGRLGPSALPIWLSRMDPKDRGPWTQWYNSKASPLMEIAPDLPA